MRSTKLVGLGMSQSFLLTSAARTLSLASVARMSDEEANDTFRLIRWAENGGNPVCPDCGGTECYTYKARRIYKCKACTRQFSVTSNTIFADRKRPIRDYLLAIAIFVNGAKGYPALQLGRDLDMSYKCAFVLAPQASRSHRSRTGKDRNTWRDRGCRRCLFRRAYPPGQLS